MPLSDHEQRLLEQLERALANEDPKFASQMRGGHTTAARRRRWVLGGLGALVGLGLVLAAVKLPQVWLGVLGFAVMVVAVAYAVAPGRSGGLGVVAEDGSGVRPPKGKPGRRPGKRGGSFMDRLDERWERRERGD